MNVRRAATLLEFLVVLAILATLVGLSLPAVQQARTRASELVCKNNLNQINLGVGQYVETHKGLPRPGTPAVIGGWSYAVLPFIEQGVLHSGTRPGIAIAAAPPAFTQPPTIMRCPHRVDRGETGMISSHYVLVPTNRRNGFLLFDAPTDLRVPWASGPEMSRPDVVRSTGPHHGGFFCAYGFQAGVGFVEHSE